MLLHCGAQLGHHRWGLFVVYRGPVRQELPSAQNIGVAAAMLYGSATFSHAIRKKIWQHAVVVLCRHFHATRPLLKKIALMALQEDLWHSVTREIERLTGQALPADLPARHFVVSLLAPGRFSHTALQAALAALGRNIASADLTRQSVSELQQLTLQVSQPS